jgi:hypothetical protein
VRTRSIETKEKTAMRTVEHAPDEFGGDRFEELRARVRDALGELAGRPRRVCSR